MTGIYKYSSGALTLRRAAAVERKITGYNVFGGVVGQGDDDGGVARGKRNEGPGRGTHNH